jgi:DnaK suppressor protein
VKTATPANAPVKKSATAAAAPARKTAAASAPLAASAASQLPYLGIEPYQEKKGETYMNPKQAAHFRVILNTWKAKLMEEMERTVIHMRDEAANFPDPNDRASQESDFALELRTRDRERKLIKKIDESLRALENNEYGFCEVCGVEIGIRRLEARPTANLCIDCKTLDEIRERQVKG